MIYNQNILTLVNKLFTFIFLTNSEVDESIVDLVERRECLTPLVSNSRGCDLAEKLCLPCCAKLLKTFWINTATALSRKESPDYQKWSFEIRSGRQQQTLCRKKIKWISVSLFHYAAAWV